MKKVLITGGSGLVGRFIVDDLHARDWRVTIAGRHAPPTGSFPPSVGFRSLHLDTSSDFRRATTGFDVLIHAGFSHVAGRYRGGEGSDIRGFWDRNFLSSLLLFQAARQTGVKQILFLSSRAVYGRQPAGMELTEDSPCHPDTHYGLVKFACEQHLGSIARQSQLYAASLRVTGVYGVSHPGAKNKWAGLIRDYLAGQPITPRLGTEVHGRDVASAVRMVLEAPPDMMSGRAFNVSDLLLDQHDILLPVRDHFGCKHPLPARVDAAGYNVMNTSKLGQLGWRPGGRSLFEQTMADIITDQSRSS